ncbi:MAG: recombinase family protein [Gammaproteobacteria bacterium]|nr:recombinase family protein [Gammaproteobacteria bacterium]
MLGQRIGYIRVSTLYQNTDRQLEGLILDQTFTEKVSAKDTHRPKLQEMIQFARKGDAIVIHSMDRLARNLDDLRSIVKTLTNKGVSVEFIKEQLIFTTDDSPMANLLLSVMGAFAEFERSLIRERQREGVALAKNRGAYKGRKRELSAEQITTIKKSIEEGQKKSEIAKTFGISRETLYRYLDDNYRTARQAKKG